MKNAIPYIICFMFAVNSIFGMYESAEGAASNSQPYIEGNNPWQRPLSSEYCKPTESFPHPDYNGKPYTFLKFFDEAGILGRSSQVSAAEHWMLCEYDLPSEFIEIEIITSGTSVRFSRADGSTDAGGLAFYFYRKIPIVGFQRKGEPEDEIPVLKVKGEHQSILLGGSHRIRLRDGTRKLVIGVSFRDAWVDTSIEFDMPWIFIRPVQ